MCWAVMAARVRSLESTRAMPWARRRRARRSAWARPRGESGISGRWTMRSALPSVSPWRIRKMDMTVSGWPRSHRDLAAVDVEARAGDVRRLVRGQEEDADGDLRRPARAPQHRPAAELRLELLER